MADRYQNRPVPANGPYDRGDNRRSLGRGESDPLAELARLIDQTDPVAGATRTGTPIPRANPRPNFQPPDESDSHPAGPPSWMQRTQRQETPQQEHDEPEYQPNPSHPLHRHAAPQHVATAPVDYDAQRYAEPEQEPNPSRYDDALFGQIEPGEQDYQRDPAYPDDPYAYQDDYEEEPELPKRKRGLVTVAAVLALAVVGTGAAFGYRTYIGSPSSGEPPIIKADNSPTKVVPTPADGIVKTPDRLPSGDGSEKLVSREETPVDLSARSGAPRVVFPPPNQNASQPPASPFPPPAAAGGTLPSNEPRKIRTLSVKGDAVENGVVPVAPPGSAAKPTTAARVAAPAPTASPPRNPPAATNANGSAPLSLTPQPSQPEPAPTQVAAANPSQAAAASTSGGYVVQVSSQKNEADAQASYRTLQSKFPNVLGSRTPLIKRADLGEKGVYYRAMVGPFGSQDEANQLCGNLKTAGGQCVVQRN